jgi:hypothetical protein
MKTLLIILFLALLNLPKVCGQGYTTNATDLITSFLKEVYQTNTNSHQVAAHYIALGKDDNELSATKRYEIAASHIDLIRKGESISTDNKIVPTPSDFNKLRIVSYTSLAEASLPPFTLTDSQKDNLYVVSLDKKVFKYFLLDNNKIASFDYLKKGQSGPAYFFSY